MKEFYEKYKAYFPAGFFIGGFLFDLLTLSRIDESFQLMQQFVYLLVTGLLLVADKSPRVAGFFQRSPSLDKVWGFRHELIHFILGSLLSVYAIFYFKSASLWNSFIFIGFLSALLVLNEFQRVKSLGSIIRFSLFALCTCSYFIYLVPIVWQQIGFFTFVFSLILSGIFFVCFLYFLAKNIYVSSKELLIQVTLPSVIVHVLFFLMYVFAFLPPVPLSIEKIGIYHDIKKVDGQYQLNYDRPWWRFWQKGAQSFVSFGGDKIHCFVSIFAPDFFKDQVAMEWWYLQNQNWTRTDRVPMQIVGGRDRGFRGYTVKSNYDAGDWQVRVVTSDQREIGRIYLTVSKSTDGTVHSYKTDIF